MNTTTQANSLIKISALIVGGIYMYRRFTEGTAEELRESTRLAPLGSFVIGWSTVYLSLSLIAPSFPGLAGGMALMVLVASLLANGIQVSKDLQAGLQTPVDERERRLRSDRRRRRGSGGANLKSPNDTEARSA